MFTPILKKIDGYVTDERVSKISKALELAEDTVNSKEFKDWFYAQTFTQLGEMAKFDKTQRLDMLLRPVSFNYHLMKKSFWKRFTSVIGWHTDDPCTPGDDIYTYIDAFDRMTVTDLAGHLAHELTHSLGFEHSFNNTPDRKFSVPYMVGDYVSENAI